MGSKWFYYTTDDKDNEERDPQMEIVVISTSEFPMRNVQKHVYPQSHTGTVAVFVLAALIGLVIGGVYWHHRRKLADLTGEYLLYLCVESVISFPWGRC